MSPLPWYTKLVGSSLFFFSADIFLSHLNRRRRRWRCCRRTCLSLSLCVCSYCSHTVRPVLSYSSLFFLRYFHICFHYSIILNRISETLHSFIVYYYNITCLEMPWRKKFNIKIFPIRRVANERVWVWKTMGFLCYLSSEITKAKQSTTTKRRIRIRRSFEWNRQSC